MSLAEKFQALSQEQRKAVKQAVLAQLSKWNGVCPCDLPDYVRTSYPYGFDYRPITEHLQAAVWELEAEGKVERNTDGYGQVILELAF